MENQESTTKPDSAASALSAGLGQCSRNGLMMDAERMAAQMAESLKTGGIAVGTDRAPKFGEWLRGIWASPSNPIRDGMYVKTVKRTGRMNPGTFYELTNGKGKFWQFEAKATVFIDAPNAKVTGSPALSASPCGLPGYAGNNKGE